MEDDQGHIALAPIRCIAVSSTQLAQRHEPAQAHAQAREAEALATHIAPVQSRQCACEPDAEGAIAEYAGRRRGRRGRAATAWRSHDVHYRIEAYRQRQKRARRGRPRQSEAAPEAVVYRLSVVAQAVSPPVESFGWLVLATTLKEPTCGDVDIVQASRDQTATVERGLRWMKNPAAISPVWLEKRERIAALAMLTVVGLLVYGLIQRQVRQY